jgi:hypothetical protein
MVFALQCCVLDGGMCDWGLEELVVKPTNQNCTYARGL